MAISSPVFTEAWGYDSENEFLNVGVNLETDLEAGELLGALKRIERLIAPDGSHRTASGAYADREVDLDLIAYGEERIDSPELTVPHPRMERRFFVLKPMAEIMPRWQHPETGKTPSELLELIQ